MKPNLQTKKAVKSQNCKTGMMKIWAFLHFDVPQQAEEWEGSNLSVFR